MTYGKLTKLFVILAAMILAGSYLIRLSLWLLNIASDIAVVGGALLFCLTFLSEGFLVREVQKRFFKKEEKENV